MSTAPDALESPTPTAWPALTAVERRVLGVLVEKAKTTPDAYPLSVNALVTGCNQKSNRDPVVCLADLEVEDALAACQQKGLVTRISNVGGSRVVRWRHNLYELWHVEKVDLAILAELLLRGPQTEGELRGRADRMEPITDLDALRGLLKPLVQRGLVVYLTPEGKRGTMVAHGFHPPQEVQKLHSHHAAAARQQETEDTRPVASISPVGARPAAPDEKVKELAARLDEAQKEIAGLRGTVTALQTDVTNLRTDFQKLKEALGA
jgi:uncharacterized protein YceH (UPF0502 family)